MYCKSSCIEPPSYTATHNEAKICHYIEHHWFLMGCQIYFNISYFLPQVALIDYLVGLSCCISVFSDNKILVKSDQKANFES